MFLIATSLLSIKPITTPLDSSHEQKTEELRNAKKVLG